MRIRSKVMEPCPESSDSIMVLTVEINLEGMTDCISQLGQRKFSNFCGKEIIQQLLKIQKNYPTNYPADV